MTYQEEFMRNHYAQIATQIGHSYQKPAGWMEIAAAVLCKMDERRTKGPMSVDHLKQEAVRLAKDAEFWNTWQTWEEAVEIHNRKFT